MWVLAMRSAKRIPRQPDLLIGFTVQPSCSCCSSSTSSAARSHARAQLRRLPDPGDHRADDGFGGFVTALGLSEDLKKGMMDRFRSLPMSRVGRAHRADAGRVSTNVVQLVVVLVVGLLVGFDFKTGIGDVVAGIALLLLIGYSFTGVRLPRPRPPPPRRP